jgi:hypothetical protein
MESATCCSDASKGWRSYKDILGPVTLMKCSKISLFALSFNSDRPGALIYSDTALELANWLKERMDVSLRPGVYSL